MFWKPGQFEQMSELGLPTIRTMSVFYHFVMTTLLEFGKLVKMVWSPQFLFYSLVTSELGKFEGEKLTLNGTIRERVEEISEECFQTEIRGAFQNLLFLLPFLTRASLEVRFQTFQNWLELFVCSEFNFSLKSWELNVEGGWWPNQNLIHKCLDFGQF